MFLVDYFRRFGIAWLIGVLVVLCNVWVSDEVDAAYTTMKTQKIDLSTYAGKPVQIIFTNGVVYRAYYLDAVGTKVPVSNVSLFTSNMVEFANYNSSLTGGKPEVYVEVYTDNANPTYTINNGSEQLPFDYSGVVLSNGNMIDTHIRVDQKLPAYSKVFMKAGKKYLFEGNVSNFWIDAPDGSKFYTNNSIDDIGGSGTVVRNHDNVSTIFSPTISGTYKIVSAPQRVYNNEYQNTPTLTFKLSEVDVTDASLVKSELYRSKKQAFTYSSMYGESYKVDFSLLTGGLGGLEAKDTFGASIERFKSDNRYGYTDKDRFVIDNEGSVAFGLNDATALLYASKTVYATRITFDRTLLASDDSTAVISTTGQKKFNSMIGNEASDYLIGAKSYDRSASEIGDPVDAFRGNFVDRRTVMSYGGNGLSFDVSYDSIANNSDKIASGFVHNFETKIVKTGTDKLDVYWNPNARTTFNKVNGIWRTSDGRKGLSVTENASGYVVKDESIEYVFDLSGKILSVVDELKLKTTYTYTNGELARVTNARDQWFDFTYESGRVSTVTDVSGRVVRFVYDYEGKLTEIVYPNGASFTIGYQLDTKTATSAAKVSTLSFDGVTLVENIYNSMGVVVKQYDGERRLTTYDYDEWSVDGEIATTYTHADGTKTTKVHDATGHVIREINELGDVRYMTYDASGNKLTETDFKGNKTTFTYDAKDQIVKTTFADGTFSTFEYDVNGRMISMTDIDGLKMTYVYDTLGRMTSMTDKQNVATTFVYDGLGNVTKQTVGDREINRVYDTRGNLTSLTLADGKVSTFEYDALDRQTSMTADGVSIATAYDVSGNVVRTTSPDGTFVTSTYNTFGNLMSSTDKAGNVTSYEYDDNGNMLSVRNGTRGVYYGYDSRNRLVYEMDKSLYSATTYTYDAVGNLLEVKDPTGQKVTREYDENGQVIAETVGSDTVRYAYDVSGRLTKTIDALGNESKVAYNNKGLKSSVTSPEGRVTAFGYDEMGRLKTATDALGNVSSVSYDANGQKSKVTDALGNPTSYKYDLNGRLIETTNALGEKSYVSYDGMGRVSETRNNRNELVAKMEYDVAGNVSKMTDGNGTTKRFVYDVSGNLLEVYDGYNKLVEKRTYNTFNEMLTSMDALNKTSSLVYDERGNVTKSTDKRGYATNYAYLNNDMLESTTNANSVVATDTFDDKGRTTKMKFSDFENNYAYDANDRLVTETMPGGNTLTYGYSADGLLTERKNGRGDVSNYTYDLNGNVLTEITKEGTKTHTYDALGRVTKTVDPSGTITRKYDVLGRVTEKTFNGKTIGYVYDDCGNLVTMTYPDGKQVKYTYDVVGNMLTVTDWNANVTKYAYDANNRLVTTTNANGTTETRTYNVAGQMTELKTVKGTTVVANYTYVYDANGNITKETDVKRGKINSYVFDKLGRLTTANTNTYAYSATGNVTSYSVAVNGVTSNNSLTYNADNQLSKVGSDLTNVDKDGNLVTYKLNGVTYVATYNSRNQLTQYGNQFYSYDAEGNRVGIRQSNGSGVTTSTTSFVVDNDSDRLSRVLVESSESGDVYYVYGNGLISEQRGGNVNTYHFDYRGSTVAMTKGDGTVIGEASYDEYGVKLGSTITTRFAYNGKFGVEDDGTGLYQMRSRYYNVDLKKFMNRDVVVGTSADSQSLNRYAYVNGNPINYTDPFGMAREVVGEYETDIESIHVALDVLGLSDGLWGTLADGLNSVIYLVEGNYRYSGFSFGAIIPGYGSYFTAGKYVEKIPGKKSVLLRNIQDLIRKRTEKFDRYKDALYDLQIPTGNSFAYDTGVSSFDSTTVGDLIHQFSGKSSKKSGSKQNSSQTNSNKPRKLRYQEGDIGTYKALNQAGSLSDDLTPHHMPAQLYLTHSMGMSATEAKNKGLSMNLEQIQGKGKGGGIHRKTKTYGRMTEAYKKYYLSLSPKEAIAHDLRDLKQLAIKEGTYDQFKPHIRRYMKEAVKYYKL